MLEARRVRVWAAYCSGGAALVHTLAINEHLVEWWGYGFFFIFASLAQGFYTIVLLLQPWTRFPATSEKAAQAAYEVGILGNLFLIVLYLVTRTVGIPGVGPGAGRVEPWSVPGILAKALEAALVLCLLYLRRHPEPTPPVAEPAPEARAA